VRQQGFAVPVRAGPLPRRAGSRYRTDPNVSVTVDGRRLSRSIHDPDEGFLLPAHGVRAGLADPVAAVVLLRRPAHGRVPHRSCEGGSAAAGSARPGGRRPWSGRADLGRLAVLRCLAKAERVPCTGVLAGPDPTNEDDCVTSCTASDASSCADICSGLDHVTPGGGTTATCGALAPHERCGVLGLKRRPRWVPATATRRTPTATPPVRGTSARSATRPCVPRSRRRSVRLGGEVRRGFF